MSASWWRPLAGLVATNSIIFCFLFVKNSLLCLKGNSMPPCRGNAVLFCSSQQLPCLCLGPLKGFFELTRRPSRALDSPRALLPELQRNKNTVRCAALGAEGPKTVSRITDANLYCEFYENTLPEAMHMFKSTLCTFYQYELVICNFVP